jgi:hypothetical protein
VTDGSLNSSLAAVTIVVKEAPVLAAAADETLALLIYDELISLLATDQQKN